MSIPLLVAAILSTLACLVHGIWGHKAPVAPMLQTDISKVSKLELGAVWHAVTLGFALSAVALFRAAQSSMQQELVQFIGWQFLLYGIAIFAVVLWQRGSLLKVPQWILMWIIAALVFWS